MIPVIIGAAALAAGAGYALGKSDEPKKVVVNTVTQKAEVSEDYVKWQLNRAGKGFSPNGGCEHTNDTFESDFKRIDQMFTEDLADDFIGHKLDELRLRARSQRDAVAMMKIADYYDKIYAYHRASLSREEAKTFSKSRNDAFESDFKRIDQMFTEDLADDFIGHKLDELRLRARSQRDAIAMMKIANYYDKIYAYHRASLSREEAKTF